jgi:hypothetical protein
MVELGTRRTTERVRVGNSLPKAARAVFLSQRNLILALVRNVGTLHVMLRENPISETHEGGKYRCM